MSNRSKTLDGRRVLVVGASSGIGRATAIAAAEAGARVAGAARRVELLADAGAERAVACDVRSPEACAALVADVVSRFGGLDAVVYTAGASSIGAVVDTGADGWRTVLDTNVVGAALVVSAALPALIDSGGRAVFLSSDSVGRPRPGLVPYAASKAALDALVAGWRRECPSVAFTRVVVGPTVTSFSDAWDPQAASAWWSRWQAEGDSPPGERFMAAEEVAAEVVAVLGSRLSVDDVTLHAAGRS